MDVNKRENIADVFRVELSFATFKNVEKKLSAIQVMEAESLKYRPPGLSQIYAMIYKDRISFHTKNSVRSLPITQVYFDQVERVLPEENLFLISFCFKIRHRYFVCCIGFKDITGYYHFMSNLSDYRGWMLDSGTSSPQTLKDYHSSSVSTISQPNYFNGHMEHNSFNLSNGPEDRRSDKVYSRRLRTTFVNWSSSSKRHQNVDEFDSESSAPSSTSRIDFLRRRRNTKSSAKVIYPSSRFCQACQQENKTPNNSRIYKHSCGLPNSEMIYCMPIKKQEISDCDETASFLTSCDSSSDSSTVYREITYQRPDTLSLPTVFECQRFRPHRSRQSSDINFRIKTRRDAGYSKKSVTAASSSSSLELRVSCDPIGEYVLDRSRRVNGKIEHEPVIVNRLPRRESIRY